MRRLSKTATIKQVERVPDSEISADIGRSTVHGQLSSPVSGGSPVSRVEFASESSL